MMQIGAAGASARAASTCACGRPLHYSDPHIQALVQDQVDELGENILISTRDRTWSVPRHYIALHGIKAWELETLGFPEVPCHRAQVPGVRDQEKP